MADVTRDRATSLLSQTIKKWIDRNSGDTEGRGVCNRLLEWVGVPEAFATVRPDGTRWGILLQDCIEAERRRRTLPDIVQQAKATEAEAIETASLLKKITPFFERHRPEPPNHNIDLDAINALHQSVDLTRRLASLALAERSRKADDAAAVLAGVGWIKGSVKYESGKPNLEAVRTLAEAALDHQGLDMNQVNRAVTASDALRLGYSRSRTTSKKPKFGSET